MSAELIIFSLRVLAALSLLAFMLALFLIVWRGLRQVDRQLQAPPETYGWLTRVSGGYDEPGGEVAHHPLRPITTLGRSASNTIVVSDDFASAEHARITLEQGTWWLEDRRSRNGTRLNEAAIEGRSILADGDVIGIGAISFRLALEREATELAR
ncbi:MAG: FHA domain-containing protein [Chloroflexi bacterium]|nr:FHA domain-containing protein [Chloroflexota bacterium]